MNLVKISLRFLLSRKKYSYTNISLYLSIFSFSFAVCVSLIVISMSRGYKIELEKSLMSIEPDLIITQQSNDFMNSFYIDSIYSLLLKSENANLFFSRFIEEYGMIKNSNYSKGMLIYSIDGEVDRFYTSVKTSNINYDNNYLLVSEEVFKKFDLENNMNINLFNINKLIEDQSIKVKKIEKVDIYKTKISTFNNNVIFLSLDDMKELFEIKDNNFTGILVNGIDSKTLNTLKLKTESFPLLFTRWDDKHNRTLHWLTIFTNPIYLILFFMIFLATIYQIFANWLIFHDKSRSLYHLKIFGISNKIITRIYHIISLTILFLSLSLGYATALLLTYIQNKYNLLELDPTIYILSGIKAITSFSDFLLILIFTFFFIFISTTLTLKKKLNLI